MEGRAVISSNYVSSRELEAIASLGSLSGHSIRYALVFRNSGIGYIFQAQLQMDFFVPRMLDAHVGLGEGQE